jgi:hypothetical protein
MKGSKPSKGPVAGACHIAEKKSSVGRCDLINGALLLASSVTIPYAKKKRPVGMIVSVAH